jgi:hypothetical protein
MDFLRLPKRKDSAGKTGEVYLDRTSLDQLLRYNTSR